MYKWLLALLMLISGCFTVSVVGFLRKDMGERYFSLINLFFGYSVVANFVYLGNFIGMVAGREFSQIMLLFYLGFIGVSFYHLAEIRRKNKAGVEWHSMSHGTSLLPLPFSEEIVLKLWEPLLVFVAGLLLRKLSAQASLWLVISGISLLINNHIVFYFERQKFLDARDAGIEARNLGKALQGKPARQTGGFVIAASTTELFRHQGGLRDAFLRMSPDLRRAFDSEADFGGGAAQG
jgi:hypothetical protein